MKYTRESLLTLLKTIAKSEEEEDSKVFAAVKILLKEDRAFGLEVLEELVSNGIREVQAIKLLLAEVRKDAEKKEAYTTTADISDLLRKEKK